MAPACWRYWLTVRSLYLHTTDRIFKKRGYERDEFLFRTVIKIRKIQFTQFLHTSASKFFLRALPRYYMLQPMLNILFYIALLSSKILVLFGLDFRAGNSKFQRPKIPAHSVMQRNQFLSRNQSACPLIFAEDK